MEHKHKYDAQGKQICCTQTEKVYTKAGAKELVKEEHHKNDGHDHSHSDDDVMTTVMPAAVHLKCFFHPSFPCYFYLLP